MKSSKKIPFFQEFPELHAAFGLDYKSNFSDINLFHYEDANPCSEDIAPYRNNFYQIFFIHRSDLTGNYNDTHIHFSPSNAYLFFTCPGKLISWRKSGDLHGYIFSFKPSFFLPGLNHSAFLRKFHFFSPENNSPVILKTKDQTTLLIQIFEKIAVEYKNDSKDQRDLIGSYVNILLIYAKRFYIDEPRPASSQAKKFINVQGSKNKNIKKEYETLLRNNFSVRKTVKEYAAMLHVTPKYLSETLKKESGRTARQILQEILMLEAKSLLLQTDLSMAEISQKLGFSDPSHFAKIFKTRIGKTPLAFSKKL